MHRPSSPRLCRPTLPLALIALALLPLAAPVGHPADPTSTHRFRFANVDDKSVGLWEGDQPVFVYNHGVILQPGVPADRARSSYVHPLYGLDGEILTDDFPKDHYHHRGLFWAWPHVKLADKEYSLWDLRGIRHQFVSWISRETSPQSATLAVENGWFVGSDKVVQEKIWLRVHPAQANERSIDVQCEWVPLRTPLTLTGAEGKSYGGLTLRFAPGTNTAITIPSGLTKQDLPMTNLPWADLTRLWDREQRTSGASILVHPNHPDFPPQWLTRHYGVLCLGWPGVKPETFPVGQTIQCRYRLWIHRGSATPDQIARAYESYRTQPSP